MPPFIALFIFVPFSATSEMSQLFSFLASRKLKKQMGSFPISRS
jgi:hypothetical protein